MNDSVSAMARLDRMVLPVTSGLRMSPPVKKADDGAATSRGA